jgi:CBS domain-containing protein
MNTHHVRRLPVVDSDGKLAGIVTRRDLLSIFLRPDADIVHDVRQVLEELPLTNPADVTVTVHHGVVTLTGAIESASQRYRDLIPIALRLASDVDGVVDVVNELSEPKGSKSAAVADQPAG